MTGQYFDRKMVLVGSAFALGVVTGLLMKGGGKEALERVRRFKWQRDFERTVEFDENLPDSLGRREPAPHPGQPRYGGTGAMGVSTAAVTARPD